MTYINLREKPDWFLEISPHGKVPVLSVGGKPLFESNAIAEYLDETAPPRLHPEDPIKRARNRAWTDFVPDFSADFGRVYYAADEAALAKGMEAARPRLAKLEEAIAKERDNEGPYFNGPELCLVDAAYAPFFQRYDFVETRLGCGAAEGVPARSGVVGRAARERTGQRLGRGHLRARVRRQPASPRRDDRAAIRLDIPRRRLRCRARPRDSDMPCPERRTRHARSPRGRDASGVARPSVERWCGSLNRSWPKASALPVPCTPLQWRALPAEVPRGCTLTGVPPMTFPGRGERCHDIPYA